MPQVKRNHEKLEKAQAATDIALKHWHEAQTTLGNCYTNGAGIFASRMDTLGTLAKARQEIEAAQAVIREIDFPTSEDYGE